MGKTNIAWTDDSSNAIYATYNGKRGWACVKPHIQCAHCYSESMNLRFGTGLPYTWENMEKVEWVLNQRELDRLANLRDKKVFVMDMSDLFGPFIPPAMRDAVMDVIEDNKRIAPQLLTKFPKEMCEYLTARWGDKPPYHIWVGATWTGPESADWLLRTPALFRYLSVEPMLSAVDLTPWLTCKLHTGKQGVDWSLPIVNLVIFGCESGPKRRHCDNVWIRDGIKQCQGVLAFVKQIQMSDGRVSKNPADWPESLKVRQLPG